MYEFICQADGRIRHDFVLETLNAIDFTNWYENEEVHRSTIVKSINDIKEVKGLKTIPVGSIEFVEGFYNKYLGIRDIKPINIPEEIFKYGKRKLWYGNEKEVIQNETFCKSADRIKKFTDIIDDKTKLKEGNYLFSEVLEDLDSEWRCFVLKGKLLGVHNYINSLGSAPNLNYVETIIEKYKGLDAYTLDVGVSKELGTVIIEIHDFFSCGLYGFNDYNKILQMLIASHNQKLRENK